MITSDKTFLRSLLHKRDNDSHKGNYGHLLLICGCKNMPGAASLATGAALQSGCGLVTLHTCENASIAAMMNFPSAMLSVEENEVFTSFKGDLSRYSSIAIGPGLGQSEKTVKAFKDVLEKAQELAIPMVIDADGLNILSQNPSFLDLIPEGSILTPHMGELKRLVGEWEDTLQRDSLIESLSRRTKCIVVAKGYGTKIFSADGQVYVNTTGNPGMAKGGSGDVLTGLCSGLLARGYDSLSAALLGVWIHGYSGDCLSRERTQEAYSSKDMIGYLWKGFKELYSE